MTDLAKLVVKLEAQTAQYQAELQRQTSRLAAYQKQTNARLAAMQRGWTSFGNTVKRTVAFASIGLAVRAIFKATSDADLALAQLNAAVKSTGGAAGFATPELVKMSAALQKQSTFADEAIQSMQSVLLQFRRIHGPEFEAAEQAILDLSTRLGKDLQSSAILVGKALNDPIKGMTALARAGVQLTKDQTETIKKLVETGEVVEAQRIILAELTKQFGGAAQAARDTLPGALKALGNAFNDLLELSQESTGGLTESVNELTKVLQDPATKAALDSLFQIIIVGAAEAIKAVTGVITTFREWFGLVSQTEKLERGIKTAMFISGKGREEVVAELRKQVDARIEFLQTQLRLGKVDPGMAQFLRAQLANLESVRNEISGEVRARGGARGHPGKEDLAAAPPSDPEALKSIDDMIAKLEEQIATFNKGAVATLKFRIEQGDLKQAFDDAGPAADALKDRLLSLTGQYERLGEGAKAAKEAEAARGQLDDLLAGLQEEIALFGKGEAATQLYRLEHGKLAEAFVKAGGSLDTLHAAIVKAIGDLDDLRKADEAAKKAEEAHNAALEEAQGIFEATRTPAEKYIETIQRLNKLFEEGAFDQAGGHDTLVRAAQQATEEFQKATEEVNKFAEEATRNVQDILGTFLEDLATTGKLSFDRLLSDFNTMLIRMAAQAVAADIAGKIFGGGGVGSGGGLLSKAAGFFGGLFGGGASTAAASGGGGSGSGLSFGGGMAQGGDVRPGAAYRVGDAGKAEWLVPQVPGRVHPENALAELVAKLLGLGPDRDRQEKVAGKGGGVMKQMVAMLARGPAGAPGLPGSPGDPGAPGAPGLPGAKGGGVMKTLLAMLGPPPAGRPGRQQGSRHDAGRQALMAMLAPLGGPAGAQPGPGHMMQRMFSEPGGARYGGNLAAGGGVRPGMGYRVGDGGKAEWLFPASAGHVVPEKAVGGEGMQVVQHFAISAPEGRVSRATQLQIAAAAQRGLATASRRND